MRNDSSDGLYVYEEGGEMIVEIPDSSEYRNAPPRPRPGDGRGRRRRRDWRSTLPARPARRVVIRRPEAEDAHAAPYPLDAAPAYGVSIGGVQLSIATIASALLTVGGIGVQLATHFVSVPEPPAGDADSVIEDLVQFNQDKDEAERKLRLLGSIGRTLSDVGQLAGLRK
jgi:hypothetical protein